MSLTAIDLFCGCGGLTRGLEAAGFDILAGLDSWKAAIEVYAANNPGHPSYQHDLSDEEATFDLVNPFKPFLIAGGPPCQDFSSAGTRTEGARADLTVKYARLVARVRPQAFIMENVERAALSEAYKIATDIVRDAGYGVSRRVLDASRCGVPQKRKRLFLVGMLGEADGFLDARLDECLGKPVTTVRSYMGNEIGFEHYYRHPRSYQRRGIYSIDEPSATIRGVNRPMPSTYKMHPNDTADPSEVDVPALSFRERARIQTFPKNYKWPDMVAKGVAEQMIGNAVPVELASYVGRQLMAHIEASGAGLGQSFLEAAE